MLKNRLLSLSILFIFVFFSINTKAQTYSSISKAEFENMLFSDLISIGNLISEKNYESKLQQLFGTPINKDCWDGPMTNHGCQIEYFGFDLTFDYDNVLFNININKPASKLVYAGNDLVPGMNLFALKNLFLDSYNNKYSVDFGDGSPIQHIIKVNIGSNNDGPSILFFYSPLTNSVTSITVRFPMEI